MPKSNFNDIFDQFNNKTVLIIGDVMVDAYIWGKVERISPEAPVPILEAIKRDYRLGGAANVALNVLSLGAKPILCSVIGDDYGSTHFFNRLEKNRISKEGIVVSNNRKTTIKTRLISGHQHIVRIDDEINHELAPKEETLLWKKIETLLPLSDVVIFEDYDKGNITQNIINQTVSLANIKSIPTIVDPKKRHFLSYCGVTLFKPNRKEFLEGLAHTNETESNATIDVLAKRLIEKLNCKGVMVTLSDQGVFIDYSNEQHTIPAHIREISDVSGAGDTVISIAALCMTLNLPVKTIAVLSNLGGGLVCEYLGVVPINKEKLLAEANKLQI